MQQPRRTARLWASTILLFSSPSLFAATTVLQQYVTESGQVKEAPPRVLIKYKSGRKDAGKAGLMRQLGAETKKEIPKLGYDVVAVPPNQTLQSFLAQLKNNPDIAAFGPDGIVHAIDIPTDPGYDISTPDQYYLHPSYTDVQTAWDTVTGSSTIVVAVIDTGATLAHPDLVNNLWVNPSPSGNSGLHGTEVELDLNGDGDCTDGFVNGFGPDQCAGPTPTDDNTLYTDGSTTNEYHGTRTAGIIGAEANGSQIVGVARGCRIMIIKALNSAGGGLYSAVAEGVVYAVDNGASVINLSLGGGEDDNGIMAAAVDYATAHNVVIVAASGNDGNANPVTFPASIPIIIAVGATDSNNSLAIFSCTGNSLDVVAPGVGILSTTNNPVNGTDAGTVASSNGTSFSAPIVSGIAALLRSLDPNMSISDVTRYIDFTATDLGTSGFDGAYGFGLVNARRAVLSAQSGTILTSGASPGDSFPYPNPFHPALGETVTFSLPSSFGTTDLEIKIFNVAGEKVKTLNGTQVWDGKNEDGNRVASGLYFYYAKTSNGDVKGKVTVIK